MSGPDVVVLTGKAAGLIGFIVGPDRWCQWGTSAQRRVLVRFPSESFPNDFRSIRADNVRLVVADEGAVPCVIRHAPRQLPRWRGRRHA